MHKVLIVIDMQNDFITGALGSRDALNVVDNVKQKIDEYHKNNQPIIFTRDTHFANYLDTEEGKHLPIQHCIYNTPGWQVHEKLDIKGCKHVDKYSFGYSHWYSMTFYEFFNEAEEIELVGVCTDICVISNALTLKAIFPNIPISVDSTCCAGSSKEAHDAALLVMKNCHVNIKQ